MELSRPVSARPDPLSWLVTNGTVTVGPVRTELLLRGVMHGRVPNDSLVREVGWTEWRAIGQIREVCALKRVLDRQIDEPNPKPPSLRESAEALSQAADAGEALLLVLHAVAHATSATVGLGHRLREPLLLPTTSCLYEAPAEALGGVMAWFDHAFVAARAGRAIFGTPDSSDGARAVSRRLVSGGTLCSVAMIPLMVGGRLSAMLELGRSDHPFRMTDERELLEFAARAELALARF